MRELARSSVAGLDLVGDEHDFVLVGYLSKRRQKTIRWDDVPALAEDSVGRN